MPLRNRPRLRRLFTRGASLADEGSAARSRQPESPNSSLKGDESSARNQAWHDGQHAAETGDSPAADAPRAEDFARDLQPAALGVERGTVTRTLYERLSEAEVAEVEGHIAAHASELPWDYEATWVPELREFLILSYGMWLKLELVAGRTGLVHPQPPEEIHSMARGPLAAAGGLYEADLVVDALASVGIDIIALRSVLD
ncbi:MAG: hypothetical protein JWN81_2686, partial [Solirubrobacterales bacterium]|nr:hypothetical protein [Solirubrobacterales bacterium]